jgi:hypothetical protein
MLEEDLFRTRGSGKIGVLAACPIVINQRTARVLAIARDWCGAYVAFFVEINNNVKYTEYVFKQYI